MPIDNFNIIGPLLSPYYIEDVFWYTEILDRSNKKGNNQVRTLRTFFHKNNAQLFEQRDTIIDLCENNNMRAYIRLAPRSYESVGKVFTELVVKSALQGQWKAMKRAYASACGTAPPVHRVWLFDVDNMERAGPLRAALEHRDVFIAQIPSRKGCHLIVKPHKIDYHHDGIELHKDNPTNLYIPDGAV